MMGRALWRCGFENLRHERGSANGDLYVKDGCMGSCAVIELEQSTGRTSKGESHPQRSF